MILAARGRPSPGRVGAVGPARLRGAREERAERHRHPGPDPRPARGRQDRHRPERQRRLVRRLHAVPGHRGVDRLARPTTTRCEICGTGITGGSYPAEIWGATCAPGTRASRRPSARSPSRPNRSSRYLSVDRDNDSGGGERAGVPSSHRAARRRRRPRSRPVRRPPRPPSTTVAAGPRPPPPDGGGGGSGGNDGGNG